MGTRELNIPRILPHDWKSLRNFCHATDYLHDSRPSRDHAEESVRIMNKRPRIRWKVATSLRFLYQKPSGLKDHHRVQPLSALVNFWRGGVVKGWERPDQAQRFPGPFGPGTPKESEKSPKGCPAPESPRVPKECATESEKSPKRVRSCVFGLFSDSVAHSLGTLGLPGAGHPFGLFSDSFGVPGLKGPGNLCAWSGGSQVKGALKYRIETSKHKINLVVWSGVP